MLIDSQKLIQSEKPIIIQSHNVILSLDYNLLQITLTWGSLAKKKDFHAVCRLVINLIKNYGFNRILNDISQPTFLHMEFHFWLLKEVIPELVKGGVVKIARVAKDEPITQTISGKYIERVEQEVIQFYPCEFKLFSCKERALSWLKI